MEPPPFHSHRQQHRHSHDESVGTHWASCATPWDVAEKEESAKPAAAPEDGGGGGGGTIDSGDDDAFPLKSGLANAEDKSHGDDGLFEDEYEWEEDDDSRLAAGYDQHCKSHGSSMESGMSLHSSDGSLQTDKLIVFDTMLSLMKNAVESEPETEPDTSHPEPNGRERPKRGRRRSSLLFRRRRSSQVETIPEEGGEESSATAEWNVGGGRVADGAPTPPEDAHGDNVDGLLHTARSHDLMCSHGHGDDLYRAARSYSGDAGKPRRRGSLQGLVNVRDKIRDHPFGSHSRSDIEYDTGAGDRPPPPVAEDKEEPPTPPPAGGGGDDKRDGQNAADECAKFWWGSTSGGQGILNSPKMRAYSSDALSKAFAASDWDCWRSHSDDLHSSVGKLGLSGAAMGPAKAAAASGGTDGHEQVDEGVEEPGEADDDPVRWKMAHGWGGVAPGNARSAAGNNNSPERTHGREQVDEGVEEPGEEADEDPARWKMTHGWGGMAPGNAGGAADSNDGPERGRRRPVRRASLLRLAEQARRRRRANRYVRSDRPGAVQMRGRVQGQMPAVLLRAAQAAAGLISTRVIGAEGGGNDSTGGQPAEEEEVVVANAVLVDDEEGGKGDVDGKGAVWEQEEGPAGAWYPNIDTSCTSSVPVAKELDPAKRRRRLLACMCLPVTAAIIAGTVLARYKTRNWEHHKSHRNGTITEHSDMVSAPGTATQHDLFTDTGPGIGMHGNETSYGHHDMVSRPEPTSAPTVDLSTYVTALSEFSDVDALNTPGTPQHSAAMWLANVDQLGRDLFDPLLQQRGALVVLHFALDGEHGSIGGTASDDDDGRGHGHGHRKATMRKEGRAGGGGRGLEHLDPLRHECEWGRAVTCVESLRRQDVVTALDMSNCVLKGEIPKEIRLLSRLESLYLNKNKLIGALPDELCQLKLLSVLELSGQQLEGTIPACIGKLTSLSALDLSNNAFSGGLFPMSQLRKLKILDLASNRLADTLPDSVGDLKSLTYLNLADNDFHGTVPQVFNRLPLAFVYLDNNEFSGEVPFLEGDMFIHRREVSLSNNHFSGNLYILASARPKKRLGSQDITSLEHLDVSNNQLTGGFPDLSGYNSLEFLNLSENPSLGGSLPGSFLETLKSLRIMMLDNCGIGGSIPPEIGTLGSLEVLGLNRNDLTGELPSELGGLSVIWNFCANQNRLSGPLPLSLSKMQSLTYLELYGNALTGTIPSELGVLSQMEDILLYENAMVGAVPDEVCALEKSGSLKSVRVDCNVDCNCCSNEGGCKQAL